MSAHNGLFGRFIHEDQKAYFGIRGLPIGQEQVILSLMNSFRTELEVHPSLSKIRHQTSVFTVGSCFAESIGNRLSNNKFFVLSNPFGTLYNPISIHKAILYALHNELPQPSTYFDHQEIWHNYEFHSSHTAATRIELEKKISNTLGTSHYFLKDVDLLIITYGTAKVYELMETGEIVANCHKMAASHFTSQVLSPEKIIDSFLVLYEKLKKWRPGLQIILTVSPVRHLKDTFALNNVSKSSLLLACHTIQSRCPGVSYFPAYEIMMDDLRDYRFYAQDMLHPSPMAVDYIWEKFSEIYFDEPTKELISRWQEIATALKHRPFHPKSTGHKKFLAQILRQLEELKSSISVQEEIDQIQLQLR